MRAAALLCIALSALVAAGCGAGETSTVVQTVTQQAPPVTVTVTTTTPAPTTSASTTPAPGRPDPERLAESGLLALDDLPDGWEELDDDDPPPPARFDCVSLGHAVSTADSPGFRNGLLAITNGAVLHGSEARASREVRAVAGDGARACVARRLTENLRRSLREQLEREDAEMRDALVGDLDVPPVGSESAGFRLEFPFEQGGEEQSMHVDMVLVRERRVVSYMAFISAYEPSPDELREQALEAVAERMRDAAG